LRKNELSEKLDNFHSIDLIGGQEKGVAMLRLEITPADKETLNHERYYYPHPHVRRKMETLWLKSEGLPHHEICRLASISEPTLSQYLKEYQQGGVEQLKQLHFYQPEIELVAYPDRLKSHFQAHPPATIKEAQAKIEELTGLKRSQTQIRAYLKAVGMKCRKVGMLPAKANPDEQAHFKQEKLDPALHQAQNGQGKLFFVDAAHFVLAPFLGFLWCFTRLFIQAPAGRQRFNVLGALDAISHDLVMITNDTYINAESFCQLLWKLRDLYPDIPITLVLDNVKYQKCQLVWSLAALLEIELLYLPPYSPNLNLIERLWKFVKKKCLYSTYYAKFEPFKQAITECLAHTHDWYQEELDTLLTLNFQTFDNLEKVNFVPV
jgi:transposase